MKYMKCGVWTSKSNKYDGPLRDNGRGAMYPGRDLCVSGLENSKDISRKEVGLRRQYDLFMVRRWKTEGSV